MMFAAQPPKRDMCVLRRHTCILGAYFSKTHCNAHYQYLYATCYFMRTCMSVSTNTLFPPTMCHKGHSPTPRLSCCIPWPYAVRTLSTLQAVAMATTAYTRRGWERGEVVKKAPQAPSGLEIADSQVHVWAGGRDGGHLR